MQFYSKEWNPKGEVLPQKDEINDEEKVPRLIFLNNVISSIFKSSPITVTSAMLPSTSPSSKTFFGGLSYTKT